MQPKRRLTDLRIRSLRPAPPSPSGRGDGRYFEMDAELSGFGVKVTQAGGKIFGLRTRYPGFRHPTWREIGSCDVLTLSEAREKARDWKKLIARGIDPAVAEEQAAAEAARRRSNTVEAVFNDFASHKLATERRGKEVERDSRREFVTPWAKRPINEITDMDVLTVVRAKKRTAPAQARNLLGYANRFFDWAIEQRAYGLNVNPCSGLKPSKIVGEKRSRSRVLNDEELFAFWRATGRMPYPVGPLYRLLLLSGVRLNEAADAELDEIDRRQGIWTIPPRRMKGKNHSAREHVVPITPAIAKILDSLPSPQRGKYIFSSTQGASPIWCGAKIKRRLDAKMLRTLKALARRRGEDPTDVVLPKFVNHDLRRTLRTNLSRLRVDRDVREAVLAHTLKGIEGVYDRYDFLPEKRDALVRWSRHLEAVVSPGDTGNVVRFDRVAR